ncbi:MAG: carboxypeptidase regulatory-like domain-containing protein, partial [Calditrichota bacterium]
GTISPPSSGAFNWAFRQGAPDQMKGPSCGFGHYSSPRTNVANALAGGLMESMFLFDIGSYGWARNYTVGNLARVMVEDGVALMPYYYSHWRYYGDPGQDCWVGVPVTLEVNHSNRITVQDNFFQVHVENPDNEPVAGAQVCIYQPEHLQKTTLTDNEGNAYFVWDEEIEATPLLVTVTGPTLRPNLGSVEVIQNAQWVLRAENIQFNDNQDGNGNGVPNPGETGRLSFDLFNRGAEGVGFDMLWLGVFSLSPWVEAEGGWGHDGGGLNPGESFEVNDAFELRVLPGCPDEEVISSMITAAWDRTHQHCGFNLQVQASRLEIELTNGNLGPNEESPVQIRLRNVGQVGTSQLNARLESTSPFITIRRGGGRYPAIAADRIADMIGDPFLVYADRSTIRGTEADFQLLIIGDPGVADTLTFSLPVGQPVPGDALGPDKYGYIALDDQDNGVRWAEAPEFNWVEICPWMPNPVFQGQALNIEMGEEADVTLLVDLPFAFRYYGREYRQISVCSNGWIAVGNQTNLRNQQNWLMPGFDGAFGQMAVFWDRLHWEGRNNGLLQFYDVQNGRFILEWVTAVSDNGQLRDNIFQAILFDPELHQTVTGDSPILFQYFLVNNVQDQNEANSHCTVGIADPEGLNGLTYTYWNQYPPACAPLAAGRAILWTTIAWEERGIIQGRVTRWIDSTAVAGASVTTSSGLQTNTGQDGFYHIVGQEPGEFSLTAAAEHYGEVIAEDLVMEEGGELVQDFILPHGWLTVPDTAFSPVSNIGN